MENIISGWLSSRKLVAPKEDNIHLVIRFYDGTEFECETE